MHHTEPVLVAYRGGEGVENDLATMRQSAALHSDIVIEVDIRFTRDGIPVAHHDETVDRMTDGRGRLSDLTWKGLRRLRLPSGHRVPSLEEVLSTVDAKVLLDLRVERDRDFDTLARLLDTVSERVLVVSESERCLRRVQSRVNVPFGASRSRAWACLLRWPYPRAPIWMVPAQLGLWSPVPAMARAKQEGEQLWVFVVDDLGTARALQQRGAEGFFTRRPLALLPLVTRPGSESSDQG